MRVIRNEPIILRLPSLGRLDLAEGIALDHSFLRPHLAALVHGHGRLHILIPSDRPLYIHDGRQPQTSITAGFYAGLLEEFLRSARGTHFPQLAALARQRNLRDINAPLPEGAALNAEIAEILFGASIAYEPLEDFFWRKVAIGIINEDNSVLLAQVGSDRNFTTPAGTAADRNQRLFQFSYRLIKALDHQFNTNLAAIAWAHQRPALAPRPPPGSKPQP